MHHLSLLMTGLLLLLSFALPDGSATVLHTGQTPLAGHQTVKLYVGLTDRAGEVVTSVPPASLQVDENGQPQKILSAVQADGPVSIGILMDISSSQRKHLPAIVNAAKSFIENSAPEDEFFLVTFGEAIHVLSDFSDRTTTLEKIAATAVENRSKVYDAIHHGLLQVQRGKYERRALLVITDGQEDGSQLHYGQLFQALKQSTAQVYCLGVGNTNSDESLGPGNYQKGRLLLEEIAQLTGGTTYLKDHPEELLKEARLLAQQLWHQYCVIYQPTVGSQANKWRKIKVRVHPQATEMKINVRHKRGYVPTH